MKIEIEFKDLSAVIYTLYSYEMYKGDHGELNTRENVLIALEEINETLADDNDGKITFVEGN